MKNQFKKLEILLFLLTFSFDEFFFHFLLSVQTLSSNVLEFNLSYLFRQAKKYFHFDTKLYLNY